MNPVITTLGPVETSHSRLTFAQAFNSIGVFLMVYGGAAFLLGDEQPIDAGTSTEAQIQAYRVAEGESICTAYMLLGVLMLVIAERSEQQKSDIQSLMHISNAVLRLQK